MAQTEHEETQSWMPTDDLPIITAKGFSAYVEAYAAYEPEAPAYRGAPASPGRLRLLSLVGSKQAVRAIWAHLIGPAGTALITTGGRVRTYQLSAADGAGWRWEDGLLPTTGSYHGVLLPVSALRRTGGLCFLLTIRPRPQPATNEPEYDPATIFYAQLNQRLGTPIHHDWADWLWETVQAAGMVTPVPGFRQFAWDVAIDPVALTTLLSAAVRDSRLPAVTG